MRNTLAEHDYVFSLHHTDDFRAMGIAIYGELKNQLKDWMQDQGIDKVRREIIWAAISEAIQNAIRYGSEPSEVIEIRAVFTGENGLEVEIKQPRSWDHCEEILGERRKRAILTQQSLPGGYGCQGGTVIMLLHAHEIQVKEAGRIVLMRFDCG